jgi:hypothetical protein
MEIEAGGATIDVVTDGLTVTDRSLWFTVANDNSSREIYDTRGAVDIIESAYIGPDAVHLTKDDFTFTGEKWNVNVSAAPDGSDWTPEVLFVVPHSTFVRQFSVSTFTSASFTIGRSSSFATGGHAWVIGPEGPDFTVTATGASIVSFEELEEEDGTLHLGVIVKFIVPHSEFVGKTFLAAREGYSVDTPVVGTISDRALYSGAVSMSCDIEIQYEKFTLPGSFDIPKTRRSLLVRDLRTRLITMEAEFRQIYSALKAGNKWTRGGFEIGGLVSSLGMIFAVIPQTSPIGAALLALGGAFSATATTAQMIEEGHANIAAAVEAVSLVVGAAAGVRARYRDAAAVRDEIFLRNIDEIEDADFDRMRDDMIVLSSFRHLDSVRSLASSNIIESESNRPVFNAAEEVPAIKIVPIRRQVSSAALQSVMDRFGIKMDSVALMREHGSVIDVGSADQRIYRVRAILAPDGVRSYYEYFEDESWNPLEQLRGSNFANVDDLLADPSSVGPDLGGRFEAQWNEYNASSGGDSGWRRTTYTYDGTRAFAQSLIEGGIQDSVRSFGVVVAGFSQKFKIPDGYSSSSMARLQALTSESRSRLSLNP